jgi:hypothetical protein
VSERHFVDEQAKRAELIGRLTDNLLAGRPPRAAIMPPSYVDFLRRRKLSIFGMVADAVTYEPVFTPKFPANRGINRDFFKSAHLLRF